MKYEYLKGSEKDFEGAPDEAIYLLELFSTKSFVSSKMVMLESMDCKVTPDDIANYCIAQRRPITEQAWSGEGVPCVGQKVMTKSGEGIIDYVGSGVIVYSNNDGQWSVRCDSLDYSLSAIRSPEDVARDEFIKELSGIVIEGSSIGTKFAAALFDAGYRKVDGE